MILSYKNKALKLLLNEGISRGLPPELTKKISLRLDAINSATNPNQLRIPGYVLHELKPKNSGKWSIRVSENWRITFEFKNENAYDVDFEDYH